ncbi:HD-GYP domain-containing protein [Psychromonas sp. PT13]|uniref:HD-GYP domain-containing protein n=1 Tax=Psychromonas sp. PT13 TaxID=3439547 RepID=UPI003EC028E5
MLKKVKVTQLRKGMYINDLKCGWLNHPFALNRFKLENENDIRKMIAAGVKVIEIDTAKGLDVSETKKVKQATRPITPIQPEVTEQQSTGTISAQQELRQAKVAFAEAGEFITEMMAHVKMGQNIELEQVNPVINKMSASVLRNQNALLGLSRIRVMDKYTFEHSVSISVLMMAFAKGLGLSNKIINEVGIGGLLHDIGKTLTPPEILNKPGKLTAEEFVIMKRHVVDSHNILQKTKGLSQIALDVAGQHHEKFDGNGYPHGLKGNAISLYGQMSAITDVYDALTADRCYHVGKEPSEVLKLLLKWSGTHFNPELVQKFIQSVGIYPPGSLVLLNNGFLAKVVDIHDNMLKPEVQILRHAKTGKVIQNQTINLTEHPKIKIMSVESYVKWDIQI